MNIPDIDLLLETKAKTDKAIAEYADMLREQLHRLENVERPQIADGRQQQRGQYYHRLRLLLSAVCRLPSSLPLLCILIGIAIGYAALCSLPSAVFTTPPIVQPAEESLEEFVAREAKRLLTTDEREKLIALAEKILQQDFARPSAIVEEFTFQRRIAGIDSPAFNAFSDKWAAKVETMQTESVEAMREIYRSLLRGLKDGRWQTADGREDVEAKNDEEEMKYVSEDFVSESPLLPSAVCNLPSPLPLIEEQKPAAQRQRLFR
jgi:hypothetical protein